MPEPFQVTGHVKWFDVGKGFGFVVPDNGLPDVLLHAACLRIDGYAGALPGARVLCDVVKVKHGARVVRVLSMDESTAITPMPQRTHVIVEPESDWERAEVRWFDRLRGFGFLTLHDGKPDVFVHMETLRRHQLSDLRPLQVVDVRWGMGPKGRMAAELRSVR
jgi:CspA family cold shock protein